MCDVFSCQRVLVQQNGDIDYGIIQLDRAATPRFTPATLTGSSGTLNAGDGLTLIGFPNGLPVKIDNGGAVLDSDAIDGGTAFVGSVDSFEGNSGSGVFNTSLQMVGILVSGADDYEQTGDCMVPVEYPADGGAAASSLPTYGAPSRPCAPRVRRASACAAPEVLPSPRVRTAAALRRMLPAPRSETVRRVGRLMLYSRSVC